jgi:hypothetical protein
MHCRPPGVVALLEWLSTQQRLDQSGLLGPNDANNYSKAPRTPNSHNKLFNDTDRDSMEAFKTLLLV